MQKKFLVNLAFLLLLNLLVKPFWIFGIDRVVNNTVGNVDYGFYFTIFNFSYMFYILLDIGITNFNNRNIAQHTQMLNKHFSSLVILKFLLCALYIIVTFAVGIIIGYRGYQLVLLGWVSFNNFLLSFILYLRSNISGMLMFITDSIVSVLDKALMILICAVLLWSGLTGGVFKIEWFVYAQTAAYVATAIVAWIIVVRKAKFRKLSWNRPFFIVILKKSLPYATLVMLMAVYYKVDSVFIERLIGGVEGKRQAGLYAQGFRMLDAVNQFAWLTAVLLLPIYSRMIKMKEDLGKMVRLPYALMLTTAIIVVACSFFYRSEIMGLLYPRGKLQTVAEYAVQHAQSTRVFGILMFGFLGIVTMYVYSTLMTASGNLKQLNIIALSGIVLNFLFNILLVPKLQATGGAIASLITQISTATGYLVVARYYFKFKTDMRFIFTIIIFALLVTGFSFGSRLLPFNWMLNMCIMLVISFLTAFILRLINIPEMVRLVKERASTEDSASDG
jgi:O-antigen/teichoic acid export membrane protein